jgi:CBS domain-containing protein
MITENVNVGELISKNLIYVNSDSNTIKAAILMRENDISCLVVKEKGDFVGIVTEKDLINKVVAEELYPGDVKIGQIMSKDLVSVLANESIEDAAKLMRKKGVRRLVVIEDDIIIGVITETDITKTVSERMDKKMFDVV